VPFLRFRRYLLEWSENDKTLCQVVLDGCRSGNQVIEHKFRDVTRKSKRTNGFTSVSVRGWGRVVLRRDGVSGIQQFVMSPRPVSPVEYTHVTYSLSFFVVRTSGSPPKRPMRTSFARSEARGELVENVWKSMNFLIFAQMQSRTYAKGGARSTSSTNGTQHHIDKFVNGNLGDQSVLVCQCVSATFVFNFALPNVPSRLAGILIE